MMAQAAISDGQDEACDLLNLILTSLSQAPLFLFTPDGSVDREPPITVSLIAFYLRTAVSPEELKKMDVEGKLKRATSWMSDEQAYCIATHNYMEFESNHSPTRGHAKCFSMSGCGNCLPCSLRMLRSGIVTNWGDNTMMAAHAGNIKVLCFVLNRLLAGVDGRNVVDTLLERDQYGNNSVIHAANDVTTGFSGLTMRLLAHAASFQSKDPSVASEALEQVRMSNVRKILNAIDLTGFNASMAAIALRNACALDALVSLRAKLFDEKRTGKKNRAKAKKGNSSLIQGTILSVMDDPTCSDRIKNLIRSLQSSSNDHTSCSFCGRPPNSRDEPLSRCVRCLRARYCNRTCQKNDHKRHKFICTAKVSKDVSWHNSHIRVPRG
jgi:hypothetical protein